jgi:hypothetical protein
MNDRPILRTSVFCLVGFLAGANVGHGTPQSAGRGVTDLAILFLVATILGISAATPSHAITCSDRQQVCFRYCEKNYANAPRCRATCGQLLSTCMSTGCWESNVTARQCGITKQ